MARPSRALFYEFPTDPMAWEVSDQYLFGPDLLVAPVMEAGVTQRPIYLPAGARWTNAWRARSPPAARPSPSTPLQTIPLFPARRGDAADSLARTCWAVRPASPSPRKARQERPFAITWHAPRIDKGYGAPNCAMVVANALVLISLSGRAASFSAMTSTAQGPE